MQQVDLKPLGRSVSCLGLGCARLDGRVALRRSAKLLEAALDLGITYFDVAASYGAAEEAVGAVIGGSTEVVVATKVGPPRAPYNAAKMRLKALVKPALDRARALKVMLRGPNPPRRHDAGNRPRYDFSPEAIERSLDGSLRRLKRDRADLFLAHEPNRLDLVPETAAGFQALADAGRIGAFGVGVDVREDRWAPFGALWQSGWPGDRVADYTPDVFHTFHGVLRYAEKDRFGATTVAPGDLLRAARRAAPNAVLIVSASTPERLHELVRAVEPS